MMSPATTITVSTDPEAYVLIRRVVVGDTRAFETLYQLYTPRLMAYLQSRIEHGYLAEEVSQDVWLVVWKQAGQFQFRSRFTTWLFGIAQRLVWKARARRVNAACEILPMPRDESEVENPELKLAGQSTHQQVAQAIASLPPMLRQTITLWYCHGWTYRQIADHLSCAENTVKGRMQQAKRLLAVKLRRVEHPLAVAV